MESDTRLASEGDASSSPAPAIFSDNATHVSSPPSSPPGFPWDKPHGTVEAVDVKPAQRSAFSLLGKRKALETIDENARSAKKIALPSAKPGSAPLAQMQISLGQSVQKKCKVCGMEYVPSSSEDRKVHEKYHKKNLEGFDVGKDFVRKTAAQASLTGARVEDVICVVERLDTSARKRRAQAVLEIVQRELGAVHIPEEELWSSLKSLNESTASKYQVYLYVRGTKCIGLLLAQRISTAYHVLEPPTLREGNNERDSTQHQTAASLLKERQQALAEQLKQPIQLSKEQYTACLGISRIWTSAKYRREHVATSLLQAALDHSIPDKLGLAMKREDMAFSQPTEAGTRLARKWFAKNFGWNVYID